VAPGALALPPADAGADRAAVGGAASEPRLLGPLHEPLRRYFHSRSRGAQLLRFATVGTTVSLVDAGLLYLLHEGFGRNVYAARGLSLGSAMALSYVLNRYFTFEAERRGPFARQLVGHFGVVAGGGLLNFGVFTALVAAGNGLLDPGLLRRLLPLLALWVGGLAGMAFNFALVRRLVFRSAAARKGAGGSRAP